MSEHKRMAETKNIQLDLGTLALGQHVLDYVLDDAFFAGLDQDEILGGKCEAHVEATVRESGASLKIGITGVVSVTCDRCLDPMNVELEPIEDQELLKLAAEDGEDDNAIYVTESHPVFDLGWLLYELIAVRLPVVHSHKEGECNPEMAAILGELKVESEEE